jgi:hypothetical protein
VTVQVVEAPELTLVGLQAKLETRVGATRLRVVLCELPPKEAVTVAVCVVVMVPRLAVNVAEVLLAGTVIDAGTVNAVLLLESPTVLPPDGAA